MYDVSMHERNRRIASMLRQIGALLQEQGVAFKPAAYRRAAQVIEELPKDVTTYGEKKDLMKLPGIGEAIAGKIIEFRDTGEISLLQNLFAEQGGLSASLMDIEGLGPKRVRQLQKELNISSVAELVDAAKRGKLRGLPLWDEKMEQKILLNAGRVKERVKRFPRTEIVGDVEKLIATIRKVKGIVKAEVAGSYRREKETVGDIDILTVTKSPHEVSEAVSTLPMVRNVAAQGDKKLSFDLQSGLRVDVRFVRADQWGAALLYFTGDKEHNIALRKVAIRKGQKLNEYGLFEGEKVIASKTEEEIYAALGVPYHEPKERTGVLK